MPMRTRICAVVSAAALLALAAGCGSDATGRPTDDASTPTVTGGIVVFAAASLTESFTTIGTAFEATNPRADVTFSFASSSALANQITQGAPADVFAAASPATMKTVTDAGDAAGEPVTFARNQLVIAVPKGNPRRVTELADLSRPGTKVALCATQIPCGAAAKQALAAGNVRLTPATLEADVKAALSKVRLGEADAALVYRTDVKAASSNVDAIEFPQSAQAINDYPIVVVKDGPNRRGARAFVDYVRSDRGRAALTAAGFQLP